jgi:hypothetical protein
VPSSTVAKTLLQTAFYCSSTPSSINSAFIFGRTVIFVMEDRDPTFVFVWKNVNINDYGQKNPSSVEYFDFIS